MDPLSAPAHVDRECGVTSCSLPDNREQLTHSLDVWPSTEQPLISLQNLFETRTLLQSYFVDILEEQLSQEKLSWKHLE